MYETIGFWNFDILKVKATMLWRSIVRADAHGTNSVERPGTVDTVAVEIQQVLDACVVLQQGSVARMNASEMNNAKHGTNL